MRKTIIAAVLATTFAAPAVMADEAASPLTFNVGVTTDYLFRGISQSQHGPALQGGIDYAHESGLYVGVWGSNISWIRANGTADKSMYETDLYGGYKGTAGPVSYDVGMIRYFYPGVSDIAAGYVTPNTTEGYVGLSWDIVSFKYSRVLSDYFVGWIGTNGSGKTQGTNYYDLTVTYPIDSTLNVIGHVGRQDVNHLSLASYTDYKIGVTKDVGFGVVGISYTDTNADKGIYTWDGEKDAKGVLSASFTKTF
jgi:uncharacterized protein (TIGR02001 family)